MPGRKYSAESGYRYGFNGKEQDKDISSLIAYDYGFRIYNPALGRFLSVDPLTQSYPWYTPYQFAGNMPVVAIDLDGLEEYVVTAYYDKGGKPTETAVSIMTERKNGAAVNQRLKKGDGSFVTDQNVLVRHVAYDGATTYTYQTSLNKQQKDIVAKAQRQLIPLIKEGGYLYYGGPDSEGQSTDDKGEYLKSEDEKLEQKIYLVSRYSSQKIVKPVKHHPDPPVQKKLVPEPKEQTEIVTSNAQFKGNSANFSNDPKADIDMLVAKVKASGVVDYSITVLGNYGGEKGSKWSDSNFEIDIITKYHNYGEVAIARANEIKQRLVDAGLDPTKIRIGLGSSENPRSGSYNVTIKKTE